jgi:hypothetical protein
MDVHIKKPWQISRVLAYALPIDIMLPRRMEVKNKDETTHATQGHVRRHASDGMHICAKLWPYHVLQHEDVEGKAFSLPLHDLTAGHF